MPRTKNTRTADGRSSIYQDEAGVWHGYVTMGTRPDGRKDRRHRRGKTESEVTRKIAELEAKRDAGKAPKVGKKKVTVGEWLTTYITTVAPRTVSESTLVSAYRPRVARMVRLIGHHRIEMLEPDHLDEMYLTMERAGLSSKSLALHHQILSRALRVAMRRGLIHRNVAQLVDSPTVVAPEIEPLTEREAAAVLNVASRRRNAGRWILAMALGLRQREALGIRWSCLDDAERELQVWQVQRSRYAHGCADPNACAKRRCRRACPPRCDRHRHAEDCPRDCRRPSHLACPEPCRRDCELHAQYCPDRRGGEYEFSRPKGRKTRTVALTDDLWSVVTAQRAAQARERLAAGSAWEADWGLMFADRRGRPIDVRDDWEEWKSILAEAGVRAGGTHAARHTAATLLLEQGVDVLTVQAILGHASLSTTKGYTKITRQLQRDALGRVDRVLRGAR